jgi:hypothetical protein
VLASDPREQGAREAWLVDAKGRHGRFFIERVDVSRDASSSRIRLEKTSFPALLDRS